MQAGIFQIMSSRGMMQIFYDVWSMDEHYHCDSYPKLIDLINVSPKCTDHYPEIQVNFTIL